MNARTMVRELSEELAIGLVLRDENRKGLAAICAETEIALKDDPITQGLLDEQFAILKPLLRMFREPEADPRASGKDDDVKRLRFAVDDLLAVLEKSYFRKLCEALREAIGHENQDAVRKLTTALLSDLTDQGWDLASLHRWHRHFMSMKKKRAYSFGENLSFMLRQMMRGQQPFDVVLRLSGSERLAEVDRFGEFSVTAAPPPSVPPEEGGRFSLPHRLARYARTTVEAVDFLPAALKARESCEKQLDLLRFDYERRIVKIDDRCCVTREGDQKVVFATVGLTVPNPVEDIDREGFDSFTKSVDYVCNHSRVEEASRVQLQAAIRQYRFGRDSASYQDMFLNWWMGLEGLAHVGRGKGIGFTVTRNVSRVMAISSFSRILRDLQMTLKYCQAAWSGQLVDISGCQGPDDLTIMGLVSLLQSQRGAELLAEQCRPNPVLAYRVGWIGGWMQDTQKAADRYGAHLRYVEWHLQRIYRIRCCIVHGAPVRYRLGLIAANLEFYLKQTILFALKVFHNNGHVRNLEDLYERASIASDQVLAGLTNPSSDARDDGLRAIRDAVFAGAVTEASAMTLPDTDAGC